MKRYAFLEVCAFVVVAVLLAINARWLNVPPAVVERVGTVATLLAILVGAALAVLVVRDIAGPARED